MRRFYYLLSPGLRRLVRRIYYYPLDLYNAITGNRHHMVPPKGKIFTGSGDFLRDGRKLVEQFKEYGGLQPDQRVLDIGCGIGRVAIPLTGVLTEQGSYEGFDVVQEGIDWCRKKIIPRYPHFNFQYIPLKNDLYNLATDQTAASISFPYQDQSFDFIASISVFTHMLPSETTHYFTEIARVLKPSGRCFATFFILGESRVQLFEEDAIALFKHDRTLNGTRYFLHDPKVATANLGYQYTWLAKALEANGLEMVGWYPGWWAGDIDRSEALNFQDVLIIKPNI